MIFCLIAGGVLASIIGYSGLLRRLVSQPFASCLVSACCCIICVLFAGALSGLLRPTQMAIFFGGFAALFAWWRGAEPAEVRAAVCEPAVAIFLLASAASFIISRDVLLIHWDEFATWATNSKYLLTADQLPVAPGAVVYADYPPGDALFQYFVVRLMGYSEANLIFAHAIFQTAALLPILAAIRWRQPVLLGSLILIGWVAGYFFGEANRTNWTSIIVDNEVAYLFAAAFTIYFLGGRDIKSVMCALPVVAALPLVKQIGLIFALAFGLLVVADKIVASSRAGLSKVGATLPEAGAALALFALPVAMSAAWIAHLHEADVHLVYTWETVYDHIAAKDFGSNTATILSNVAETISGHTAISAGGLGFPAWIAALAILAIIATIAQNSPEHRKRVAAVHVMMTVLLVLYIAFLVSLYVFAYPPNGGLQLQSFSRYLGSFLVAWFCIGLVSLIYERQPASRRFLVPSCVALVACVAVYVTREQVLSSLRYHARGDSISTELLATRMSVKARLGSFGDIVPPDSRVYSVWNGTTGLSFFMSVLELKPRATNDSCFSVGKPRFVGDAWSCDYAVTTFRELLGSYDFLFVGKADGLFWDRYQELFAPDARRSGFAFFKVDTSAQYLLSPVSVSGDQQVH